MNQFKLQGLVTRHKTFGTPSGGFGSNTSIKCETTGTDGKVRESIIQCEIWHQNVMDIREGDMIAVIGVLRNVKSKDRAGNELWALKPSGNDFKIIAPETHKTLFNDFKSNLNAKAPVLNNDPSLSEEDVPF